MFLRPPPRPKTIRTRTLAQRVGEAAEAVAADYLVQKGLRIIARNVRYPDGELDVIASEGETLVFVEVRLRVDQSHGGALASVDVHKRRRLIRAAQHYLNAHTRDGKHPMPPCRFDVIAVNAQGVSDWVRGAFDVEE